MENLDEYTTSELLSRVPAESVLQCKSVCKNWRNLLSYIKVGLLLAIEFREGWNRGIQLYYGEYDDIDTDEQYSLETLITRINHPPIENQFNIDVIVGSCNGLVCFSKPDFFIEDPVYICNPYTGENVNLPRSIHIGRGFMVSGFGYHHSADEYKVVRIYYRNKRSVGQVEVYTLGSGNGWRDVGEISYSFSTSPGILANGALHWLDCAEWKIVSFDLADEEFRVLQSPPCFFRAELAFYKLQVLAGCLCVVHHERGNRLDIWALKKTKKNSSYDVNEQGYHSWSWSREFSIARECLEEDGDYEPFALTRSNEVLLWYNGTVLSCYDPKTETLKKLMDDDDDMGIEYFRAIPHMNSYVSLEALGEESEEILSDHLNEY